MPPFRAQACNFAATERREQTWGRGQRLAAVPTKHHCRRQRLEPPARHRP